VALVQISSASTAAGSKNSQKLRAPKLITNKVKRIKNYLNEREVNTMWGYGFGGGWGGCDSFGILGGLIGLAQGFINSWPCGWGCGGWW
jgi:hypothetical protein